MDDDGLNMRNWGFYEPSVKGNLGLQLMSPMVDRDTKPFISGRDGGVMAAANGMFHPHPRDYMVPGDPGHIDLVRDNWINHREKFHYMFPGNAYTGVLADTSGSHQMQMLQQEDPDSIKDSRVKVEDVDVDVKLDSASGSGKRRAAAGVPKAPKSKKPKKTSAVPKENGSSSGQRTKAAKRNMDVVINGIDLNISDMPIPVCSCTGTPQQCYRWGCGGWQSACCTTTISMYPLPMSTKRRGARIAGRKMSQGAFKKVLEKLAAEGYDFTNPIDLRTHWAKHGTNKFVTIR